MEKKTLLGLCAVLVFITTSAGVSQNSELSCPSTFYKEISPTLHLTIVNSTFSVCDRAATLVTCRWAPKVGFQSIVCRGNVTRCEKDATSPRCRCVEENEQGFKYSFNFSMVRNQEQGFIYCDFLDCTKATVDSSEKCSNITFVSKCHKNGQCKRGTCRINENKDDVCDCTGTGFVGAFCEIMDHVVIALICVSTLLGVVMAAAVGAGVYCARKQKSGGQQNAPPADVPPANAPPDHTPPYNGPSDNSPQVNGSAGPSTGQAVPTTPYDEPYESSDAGTDASEGTDYSASEVSEV